MAHGGHGVAAYLAALKNDPFYRQSVADVNASNSAYGAQLGSGIMQALATRGIVPNLANVSKELGLPPNVVKWIMKNVDLGTTSSLATAGNSAGTSQQAQIDLGHQTNMQHITDSLAARGMLQSGATPEETGAEAQNYKLANFNADSALSSYINGAYSAFAQAKKQNALGLNGALQQAYQRALQMYGSTPPPGIGHQRPPGSGPSPHTRLGGPGPHVRASIGGPGRPAYGV